MNLKRQTGISLIWNTLNKTGNQLIALLAGIITARILSPDDFGYIAALALFTMLSNILVESGFTAALVRRPSNTQAEYNAAFIFNFVLSIVFYIILFVCAPIIANYYKMPPLTNLARVIFLAIIFNSLAIIPNIILTHDLKFKQIAVAELTASVISAVVTIVLALCGFAYWAIAAQQLSQTLAKAILLWILSNWKPSATFNFKVIRELLSFSGLLIISAILSNTAKYLYNFIIGPRYNSTQLGYYGQAFKFHQIPPNVIGQSVTGVAYPIISHLNNEPERQLQYEMKVLAINAFITFPIMIGLFAMAPNFIAVILTRKWLPMLPYFRLLLVAGTAMPFITLHLNILNSINKPHLYFILELIRNGLMIALLFVLNKNILVMISGYLIANYLMWLVDGIVIAHLTRFKLLLQLKQLLPSAIIALSTGLAVYTVGRKCTLAEPIALLLQIAVCACLYIGFAWAFKLPIATEIKNFFKQKYDNETQRSDTTTV